MTPQGAIMRIKEHNQIHSKKERNAVFITEALNMAVSALEKQIPKKPLDKSMEYNGEYGECPCCHKPLYEFNDMFVCSSCGQALDWSDTK